MGAGEVFEKVGGWLTAGFGDKVLIGFLMSLLDGVTPEEFYLSVKQNKDLLGGISPEDWDNIVNYASKMDLSEITTERVIQEFKKHQPDLHQILTNHPGAIDWLDAQVIAIKAKLSLS